MPCYAWCGGDKCPHAFLLPVSTQILATLGIYSAKTHDPTGTGDAMGNKTNTYCLENRTYHRRKPCNVQV